MNSSIKGENILKGKLRLTNKFKNSGFQTITHPN